VRNLEFYYVTTSVCGKFDAAELIELGSCMINSTTKETETQKEGKKYKEQGNKHFAKGEYVEAEHFFTLAIECTINDNTSVDERKQRAVYFNNRAAARYRL
jgi:hypothetical protein